jgi:hypothetical protein
MSLKDIFGSDSPIGVSFEFSPPRTAAMEEQLWKAILRLEPLTPTFVSVTYGAGGSTRDRTHATVKRIVQETGLKPAAHLTCVGAPKAEIDEIVRQYWDAGVRHIVALRGDMPEMAQPYRPHAEGYATTPDLIGGIRAIGDFEISVSCYPEKHPESPSFEHDLDLLKKKGRGGGFARHHPVLFLDRSAGALSRPRRPLGHCDPDRSGPDADHQFQRASSACRRVAGRRSRRGWQRFTKVWTTISKAAASWPPPCWPSRSASCTPTASSSSTSTP